VASNKQVQAARRNVKKARAAAEERRSIAHLPAKTRTALGKQGAAVAQRKRTGGASPRTRQELYDEAKRREPPGPVQDGTGRTRPRPGPRVGARESEPTPGTKPPA